MHSIIPYASLFSSRTSSMTKRHILRLSLLVLVAGGLLITAGVTLTLGAREEAASPRTVRVVMDNNYPPYVFHDSSGNLQGILIDQWRLWEKKTGVRADISAMDWGKALRRMEQGEFEVIDTIFLNERRAALFDFTKPYAKIDVSIFFHKNITGIVNADSIKGFAVAVKAGDAAVDLLRQRGVTQLLEFNSYEAIIEAAREQKITVFVMDKPPALYFMYKMGLQNEFKFTEPLYVGEFHRAVTKSYRKTLNLVEDGFSRISSAEYDAIDRKWYGNHATLPSYLTYLAYAAAVLAVLMLALAGWNHTLRKRVREKTKGMLDVLENLKRSEERYRELVESANSIILRMDRSGTIVFFNEFAQRFFGYGEGEILGRSVVGTILKDSECSARNLGDLVANIGARPEQYASIMSENVRRNGERVWVAWTNKPVLGPDGQVVEILCVGIDMTERKHAEEELRQSEAKLRAITHSTQDAILMMDPAGRISYWNPAAEKMFGWSEQEALGRDLHTFLAPDRFAGAYRENIRQFTVFGKGYAVDKTLELTARRKGGKEFPIELSLSAIQLADGWHAVGILRDITERKRAEEVVRESERKLADIIDFLPDATLVIDREGRVIAWNRAIEAMTGIPAAEMLGKGDREYSLPFYGVRCPILIDLALHADPEREMSYTAIHRTGDTIFGESFVPGLPTGHAHLSATASVLRDAKGDVVAAIECIRDNTEKKRAEEALRQSEARWQFALEGGAGDGLWDWNVKTGEVFFSCRWKEMLGYEENEIGNRLDEWDQRVHPDDRDQVHADIRSHMAGQAAVYVNEHRMWCRDGTYKWILDRGKVISRSADGSPLRMIGTHSDISGRKRDEEERRELAGRLQRAEKMEALGLLAGGVAHDLNNVLGILVGYSELLLEDVDPSSPLRPNAEYIKQGGVRAAAIVQDLLTLARRGVQTKEVVDLNGLIDEFRHSPEFEAIRAHHPRVEFNAVLSTGLLNIKGSPTHLRKTIMNLVSNAAEAIPAGGLVVVTTSNQYLDRPLPGYDRIEEGDYVVLSVSDTGEGLTEGDMRKIFEPFYTKKVMGRSGTGLGLAVVWGTVKDHNGYINVRSELGKGTTFTLHFPVTREDVRTERRSVPVAEYMGEGESILVVDDVKGQRELAEQMLQRLNYRVVTASSGEEAVEYLKQHRMDMLVLDMIMDPGIDGLETYRRILEIYPQLPAVIVSGFSESDRVRQAQALGAGTYVRKPYVSETLGLAIKGEFDRQASRTILPPNR